MPLKIGFNQLPVRCIIGVLPSERKEPQLLTIDLRVEIESPSLDRLESSVDYCSLAEAVKRISEKQFFLLERFALEVVDYLLAHFPIQSVWIRITKPGVVQGADAVVEWES